MTRRKDSKVKVKQRQKVKVECFLCHEEFLRKPSEVKGVKKIFCSLECRDREKKVPINDSKPILDKQILTPCAVCNNLFKLGDRKVYQVSNIIESEKLYCSTKCYTNRFGKKERLPNPSFVYINCKQCEKKILSNQGRIKRSLSGDLFCSIKCLSDFRSRKLEISCSNCSKLFSICKAFVNRNKSGYIFCSKQCCFEFRKSRKSNFEKTNPKEYVQTKCANCTKSIVRVTSNILKTKNKFSFCSASCSTNYLTKNGLIEIKFYKVSRLEKYIQEYIKTNYNIKVVFNNRKIVGSELDILFPDISLAIEINGPYHYRPIYGQERLDKVIIKDFNKKIACLNKQIRLIVVNASNHTGKKLKENNVYLSAVRNIIDNQLSGAMNHEFDYQI